MASGEYFFASPVGVASVQWQEDDAGWRCAGVRLPPIEAGPLMKELPAAAARFIAVLTDQASVAERRWALQQCQWGAVSDFTRMVLETLSLKTNYGDVLTYGELALLTGRPGAARAVGSVMAQNPFPLLCPCHRVIAAGGRLGNFQAGLVDGRERKRALLRAEGCAQAEVLKE